MSVGISSVAISHQLKKIEMECGDHNRSRNMTWVINEFLMNCGEQPIINNYLDCLPEEILQIIYRFVNQENIKKLSIDGFEDPDDFRRLQHTNGRRYQYEKSHHSQEFGLMGRRQHSYHSIPRREHQRIVHRSEDYIHLNAYNFKKHLYGNINMNSKKTIYDLEEKLLEYLPEFEYYTYEGVKFKLNKVFVDTDCQALIVNCEYKNRIHSFKRCIYLMSWDVKARNKKNIDTHKINNHFETYDGDAWKAIRQD